MPLDRPSIAVILKRIHLFRGADDQVLEDAAALAEEVEYPAGATIYLQDSAPDYFFIVASGKVQISYSTRSNPKVSLGQLEEDDYFGEEVLELNWPRQCTAEAVSDVTLLRISVDHFKSMLELIQPLSQRLQFILDSFKLMLQIDLPWREADEAVYFIARRHIVFLFRMIAPSVIAGTFLIPLLIYFYIQTNLVTILGLLIITFILDLAKFVWDFVDWTNDFYIVTSHRVVYQERVVLLYDSRQESPLPAIQSSTITTTQWGRWLGYGNVAIRTFYGTLLFRNVANPEQTNAVIQQQQIRAQVTQRKVDIRNIGKFLDERIRSGPKLPTFGLPKKPPPPPDPMREFLSTMFHLRYETGHTIIYRTHWFILIQKTFAPGLILFSLLLLFLLSAFNRFEYLSLSATCGVVFVFGAVVGAWWLYQYIDWHNDLYLITVDQVVDVNKKPLGREERQSALIKNIISIEYRRLGLSGLLLNFGTVYIRVGDKQLTFDDVFRPSEVQRELFHRLAEVGTQERQAQIEAEKQRLGDWFASYDERVRKQSETKPPAPFPPVRDGF